ncbi:MAG: Coenzyme F420 hydrogenase/dehydrogenase, beta subunit C-terminal domain [bacterium]
MRNIIKIDKKENCSGCKACYNICPVDCIEMSIDEEGFWYPEVDKDKCINCELCKKVCPEINIYINQGALEKPITLAAWNQDELIRMKSSSGGIFTGLAEWIIAEDGVVYGAGFDDEFQLKHKGVTTEIGIGELRGSKYIQSDISETYYLAKNDLENETKALFVGTPCQIAGLKNYLQKEYKNLYTCDLVCHGVPSPMVFDKYREYLEDKHGSAMNNINFRDKMSGWKRYSLSAIFDDNSKYSSTVKENNYMIGFLRDIYLRPSCYTCSYKGIPRTADITLGDFWGVGERYPELDDDKGTSLLLINTEKGKYMIDSSTDGIFTEECKLEAAVEGNPCIVRPVNEPKRRKLFFRDLKQKEFSNIISRYMSRPSWLKRKILGLRRRVLRLFTEG